jgi:hypothetical protein
MEKLKKAHLTLDVAKVEAKKTLAPILERMKHGREIRSAEKVLKGMSTTLEFPFMMKRALDRGDFKEVVALYQRVQSIPGNSSLKIVPRIKKAAEGVISELKKLCLSQLLNPTLNYSEINKHAQLLLELEGPSFYVQVLRQSFVRQLLHFMAICKEAKLKFLADSVEAFDKGQELNIVSKNGNIFVGNGENETIVNVVKKFVSAARKRSVSIHESTKTSKRASTSRTSVLRGGITNFPVMDDFAGEGGDDDSNEFDDEYIDEGIIQDAGGIELWIQSILTQSSKDSPSTRRGSVSPFSNTSSVPDQDDVRYRDYSEILCHFVRKSFCEQVIEIVTRSFTCLFRLVYCSVYPSITLFIFSINIS